jgi:hypothetical protein
MKRRLSSLLTLRTLLSLALAFTLPALAAPGAHGPNGEHLDGAATTSATGTAPRVETFSELFELVGNLSGGELSILIDRYDTNEPVLNGKLEVQYKELKAQAKFHSDIGDYAIDDEKFLKALAAPGKHALLFTFVADGDSDLLEGTLEVAAAAHDDHASRWRWWWLLPVPVLAALAILVARARRRPSTRGNA